MRLTPIACAAVFAGLASSASAQLRPTPYVVDLLETVRLIGYDYSYGFADPGSTSVGFNEDKHGFNLTTNPKSAFLRLIVDSLNGHLPYPRQATIHRGDEIGRTIGFKATGLHSVNFPALQSTSTEVGRVRMVLNSNPGGPLFLGQQPLNASEFEAVKADRKKTPWLVNAFHFKLNGVEDHMVSGVSGFTLVNVGDLDGDGMPDFRTTAPIEITIPEELLPKYLGWLDPDPTVQRVFKICWVDAFGEPFLTFRGVMNPAGWGYADPFGTPTEGRPVTVRINRGDVAMTTDTTCSMSGSI